MKTIRGRLLLMLLAGLGVVLAAGGAAVHRIARLDPKGYELSICFIALDKQGRWGAAASNQRFPFAVATEAFFERPDAMQARHPDLYAAMERIFRPGFRDRLSEFARERGRRPKEFGRNSPCPCGSGKKFKKCCLR